MIRSIRFALLCAVACGTLADTNEAGAKLTEQDIRALQLGGYRLGMTRSEVDASIAARTDITEPHISNLGSFDCNVLLPDTEWIEDYPYVVPDSISFEDAARHQYSLNFTRQPDEDRLESISYFERRGIGTWATYLSELEARFGKADVLGHDRYGTEIAVWCTDARDCRIADDDPRGPLLSVRMHAHSPTAVYPGDWLRFTVFEGRDRSDERRRSYKALLETDSDQARRLAASCLGAAGRFSSWGQADRHYLLLMDMGPRARAIIDQPLKIPAQVFAALGINRDKHFALGVCFNSSDVIFERPECKSQTMTGFRWARQVGDLWLVSLSFGGASLRREYFAVRKDRGAYRKVWWADDLTRFNAWRKDGAIAMIEPLRER